MSEYKLGLLSQLERGQLQLMQCIYSCTTQPEPDESIKTKYRQWLWAVLCSKATGYRFLTATGHGEIGTIK